jgi:microcystin-dependent protein
MADPFIAEIRMFGFNFAPVGWAACDGQLLPLAQNTALFSLLGTTYGGNGQNNFGLPNLQGACALGVGAGPGLAQRVLGEQGGQAAVSLSSAQLPGHTHRLTATASPTTGSPAGALLSATANGSPAYKGSGTLVPLAAGAVQPAGQGQAHENRPPSLVLMFCIALQGVYPPRG